MSHVRVDLDRAARDQQPEQQTVGREDEHRGQRVGDLAPHLPWRGHGVQDAPAGQASAQQYVDQEPDGSCGQRVAQEVGHQHGQCHLCQGGAAATGHA